MFQASNNSSTLSSDIEERILCLSVDCRPKDPSCVCIVLCVLELESD